MSEKLMTLSVDTAAGITVEHLYYHHERAPAEKLLVVLPGQGYLPSHPVLHYLQKMARSLGYDVLSIQYSFQAAPQASGGKAPGWDELTDEANHAMRVLPRQDYVGRSPRCICFAGKSLGTPLAVTLAQSSLAEDTRLLLLTPIANAVESAGEIPTLAVIGTADTAYNAAAVAADADRANITWRVFEGLNHGLEADDWRESVNALVEIIAACEDFLRA